MGGSVQLAIKRDGKIRSGTGWTGLLHTPRNPRFFSDPEWLEDFLRAIKASPRQAAAPFEYGLCSVDFDAQRIAHAQSYCDVMAFSQGSLALCAQGIEAAEFDDDLTLNQFYAAHEAGWLQGSPFPPGPISADDRAQFLLSFKSSSRHSSFWRAKWKCLPPGWVCERFDNDAQGFESLFKTLTGAGWKWRPKDIRAWQAHARNNPLANPAFYSSFTTALSEEAALRRSAKTPLAPQRIPATSRPQRRGL